MSTFVQEHVTSKEPPKSSQLTNEDGLVILLLVEASHAPVHLREEGVGAEVR